MPQKNLSKQLTSKPKAKKRKYNKLALGGTFDHFHKGHHYFLSKAFKLSNQVIVGITSSKFASQLHPKAKLQSFKVRKKQVENYIKHNKFQERTSLITLSDPFGTTLKDPKLESLLTTENTLSRGKHLNKKRQNNQLPALDIINCQLLNSEDDKPISSSRIRIGEISREGVSYFRVLSQTTPLTISRNHRDKFKKPFGRIFPNHDSGNKETMQQTYRWIKSKSLEPVICVGDVVTKIYLEIGGKPKLKIIDLKVQRKTKYKSTTDLGPIGHLPHYKIVNSPGSITTDLVNNIDRCLKRATPGVIHVDGEEDLAVLPCTLLAPLGSVVLYGHFQFGVIAVKITEAKKQEALNLLYQISKSKNE